METELSVFHNDFSFEKQTLVNLVIPFPFNEVDSGKCDMFYMQRNAKNEGCFMNNGIIVAFV